MSSDKRCCVPGCKENKDSHRVLHMFPNPDKDRNRFNKWVYKIGGDILSLPDEQIYKYRRICRIHFEEKYQCRYNKLSKNAVPTENLSGSQPHVSSEVDKSQKSNTPVGKESLGLESQSVAVDSNVFHSYWVSSPNEDPLSGLPELEEEMQDSMNQKPKDLAMKDNITDIVNENESSKIDVKVLDLLNVKQTSNPQINNSKSVLPVKKIVSKRDQVKLKDQQSKSLVIQESKVWPITKECRVTLQKLPQFISNYTSESACISTIKAPDKIDKVVSINNKVLLVEENENEQELNRNDIENVSIHDKYMENGILPENQKVNDGSSVEEDCSPKKDVCVSNCDSNKVSTSIVHLDAMKNKPEINKNLEEEVQKLRERQLKLLEEHTNTVHPTKTYRNSLSAMKKPHNTKEMDVSKKMMISKKPIPSSYKSNNPFDGNTETIDYRSNEQDELVYKSPYPGIYVARSRNNDNVVQDSFKTNVTSNRSENVKENFQAPELTRVIEDFVDYFADVLNYEWYNDQDVLIYGRHGTAMVLLHEAKYNIIKAKVQEAKIREKELKDLNTLREDYGKVIEKNKLVQKELYNVRMKYIPLKSLFKKLLKETKMLRIMKDNLHKLYSEAQISIMLRNKRQCKIKWSPDDVRKAIYINQIVTPKAYQFLRDHMKFPLPCPEIVRKWMRERNIYPNSRFSRPRKKCVKFKNIAVGTNKCNAPFGNGQITNLNRPFYENTNTPNKQKQDVEITNIPEAHKNNVEIQQADEMIVEQQKVGLIQNAVNAERKAGPVYADGDLVLAYMDDNNVNAKYYLMEENYVTSEHANESNDARYVVGEIYTQVNIENGNNYKDDKNSYVDGDNSVRDINKDDTHYVDSDNYTEHCNIDNENNAQYIDDNNQIQRTNNVFHNTEYSNSVNDNGENYAPEVNVDNKTHCNENNTEVIDRGENKEQNPRRYSKWNLHNVQKFSQLRKCNWKTTCQLCMRPFQTEEDLEEHVPIHYDKTCCTPYLFAKKPYVCEFCNKNLPHKYAVVHHHIAHLDISGFKCWHPGCTYIGKNKRCLASHMDRHLPRIHSCPQCPAVFVRRKALREHFGRRHSTRGAYRCHLCKCLCLSEYTFHRHMMSHNKPPRYKCPVEGCTEAFYSRRAVSSHRLSHYGSDKYQCPHCPFATFVYHHQLKRHLERHEKNQISKCNKCHKIFDSFTEYYTHIKTDTHNNKCTLYTCACKETFKYKKMFVTHQTKCQFVVRNKKKNRIFAHKYKLDKVMSQENVPFQFKETKKGKSQLSMPMREILTSYRETAFLYGDKIILAKKIVAPQKDTNLKRDIKKNVKLQKKRTKTLAAGLEESTEYKLVKPDKIYSGKAKLTNRQMPIGQHCDVKSDVITSKNINLDGDLISMCLDNNQRQDMPMVKLDQILPSSRKSSCENPEKEDIILSDGYHQHTQASYQQEDLIAPITVLHGENISSNGNNSQETTSVLSQKSHQQLLISDNWTSDREEKVKQDILNLQQELQEKQRSLINSPEAITMYSVNDEQKIMEEALTRLYTPFPASKGNRTVQKVNMIKAVPIHQLNHQQGDIDMLIKNLMRFDGNSIESTLSGENSNELIIPGGNNSALILPDGNSNELILSDGNSCELIMSGENGSKLVIPEANNTLILPDGNSSELIIPPGNNSILLLPDGNTNELIQSDRNSCELILSVGNNNALILPYENSNELTLPGIKSNVLILPDGNSNDLILPDGNSNNLILPDGNSNDLILPDENSNALILPNENSNALLRPDRNRNELILPDGTELILEQNIIDIKKSYKQNATALNQAIDSRKKIVAPMIKIEQITKLKNENNKVNILENKVLVQEKKLNILDQKPLIIPKKQPPKVIKVCKKNIFQKININEFNHMMAINLREQLKLIPNSIPRANEVEKQNN